jgi:methylated-DNA-[protein]-cysteine S-methyltransferase
MNELKFNEKVWALMKRIPKGNITTYKIIAEKINTKAYRAVGNACRRNPNPPYIPCHRVVKTNGGIGGFKGKTSGTSIQEKILLLEKEGIDIKNEKIVNFKEVLFKF